MAHEPDPLDELVARVQRAFPQIYLACHARHVRRDSTRAGLTDQDSTYLGHLSRSRGTRPQELAAHLGVNGPTLSAFLKRMQELGYVERVQRDEDRRLVDVFLTDAGEQARRDTSVLDTGRLNAVLADMPAAERSAAVAGLESLARACTAARREYERGCGE